jgi:hypothetical protein
LGDALSPDPCERAVRCEDITPTTRAERHSKRKETFPQFLARPVKPWEQRARLNAHQRQLANYQIPLAEGQIDHLKELLVHISFFRGDVAFYVINGCNTGQCLLRYQSLILDLNWLDKRKMLPANRHIQYLLETVSPLFGVE